MGHDHSLSGHEYITNASDVVLNIGGNKAGNQAKIVVNDFEFSETNNVTAKHGVGNHNPTGFTFGNATYQFDFTLHGENAQLFRKLALNNDGTPPDIQITGSGAESNWRIDHAFPEERAFSGTDDDATEYTGTLNCGPIKTS